MKVLVKNGIIVTLNKNFQIIPNGYIKIDGKKISEIGEGNPDVDEKEFDHVIDAGSRLVMPGLVNAHHHFYSTFATGLLKIKPSLNFIEVLENLWWRLDRALGYEDIYYSAMIPLLRSVKAGVTTIFDHHSSPNAIEGSLDYIKNAMKKVGLKGGLCYEVSDRDGSDKAELGIRENLRFIVENQGSSTIKGLFGLHAAFTISYSTFTKVAEALEGLDTGIHVHTAEDISDEILTYKSTGRRVIEWLSDFNLINRKSILVHGIHLSDDEILLIKEKRAVLVHNPQSNLNNAVGFLDIKKMISKGILLCLGSDGMTSNMFEELRTSIFASHYYYKHPNATFNEQVVMLILNNFLLARRFFGESFGMIEKGSPADIVVFDYIPYTPLSSKNFGGHLVYGISQSRARDVIVDGNPILLDFKFLNIDEEEISEKAMIRAQKVWQNM